MSGSQTPDPNHVDRDDLRARIAERHRVVFNFDQVERIDEYLEIALINGWTEDELFDLVDPSVLDGFADLEDELVELYGHLGIAQ